MSSPILMQNDNLAKELSKENVGRSGFNLSHSKTLPMYLGAIYPICLLPTMPTESLEISVTALLKQLSPLTVPLMADLRLNTAFYWCDYRLGWKKFERFMQGGRSGNETYNLPKFVDDENNAYLVSLSDSDSLKRSVHNSLRTYFGVTKEAVTDSSTLPEAFPFFAYQMIVRDFYTNVDRLNENYQAQPTKYDNDDDWSYNNLFPANPDTFRLSDGNNISVNGVRIGKLRYHEFRPDYFLSSTYAPMRGTAPTLTIPLEDINFSGDITLNNPTANTQIIGANGVQYLTTMYQGQTSTNKIQTGPLVSGAPNGRSLVYTNGSGTQSAIPNDYNLVTVLNGKIADKITSSAFSANVAQQFANVSVTSAQLTWLNQLTTWKELNVLTKPYYSDFLNAHFTNVKIGEEQTERPVYIGGTSQKISITEVTQVSASTDSSPMGSVGAKVGSLDSNKVGQFFCNDYGFVIGVAYIMPDILYEPAMPRWLNRSENLDFYSPEFANLSMQAVLNKEFYVSNDNSWNNQVLGYQGSFDELRSMPNQVAGDLLNDNYTDLKHYVLMREFDNSNKPSLTQKFLNMRDNIDYSAFATGDTIPPFIGQFANMVNAIMPMPYVAVPKH